MIFSKWLVDEELAQKTSIQFKLIRTIVNCDISIKMLVKVEILAFRNFF